MVLRCEWCSEPSVHQCSGCGYLQICSKACLKRLWPEHGSVCSRIKTLGKKKKGQLFTKGGDLVKSYAGEGEQEETDFFLRLPYNVRRLLVEFVDVKTICRTESVMKGNIYSHVAWQNATKGIHSVALSQWQDYSNVDNFCGLVWSMNRRFILKGASIREIQDARGDALREAKHMQFYWLCESNNKAHHTVAAYLVRSGFFSDINEEITGRYYTPVFTAAQHERIDLLEACVKAGGAVDKRQYNSFTSLFFCAQSNKFASVNALLKAGADPNIRSDDNASPLLIASERGCLESVNILLGHGADIRATLGFEKKTAYSPLHLAAYHGHTLVVKTLLAHGAPVNGPDFDDVEEADRVEPPFLGVVHRLNKSGHAQILPALAKAGADVNYATKRQYFIEKGGHPCMSSDETMYVNAIIRAVSTDELYLLHQLISFGADVDDFIAGKCHYAPMDSGLPQKAAEAMQGLKERGWR